MQKAKLFFLLLIAAFLYTLGFPNVLSLYLPIGPLFSYIILFKVLNAEEKLKFQIAKYFLYNLFITLISFYWVASTFKEFGGLPLPVALLLNTLFTFILNPHIWVFLVLKHFIIKKNIISKFISLRALIPLLYALVLTTLEYWIPQQFPIMLGQPWIIFSDSLGLASIFGIPAYSFFSYLVVMQFLDHSTPKKIKIFNYISVIIFIAINPLLSSHSSLQEAQLENDNVNSKKINIRLVQANISNFLKIASEQGRYASVQEVIQRYHQLSIKPNKDLESIDLIVWPETAYPYSITTDKEKLSNSAIPLVFNHVAKSTKAYTLFGGYDHTKDNADGSMYQTDFNSAMLLNPDGELSQIYHKHILIPFGETLPFGPLNEIISKYLPEIAFFAKGVDYTVFNIKDKFKFISSICYELIQPEYIREYLNQANERADFMINLTNDSWYGDTIEPEQHLFLAKWRAIEFKLPIVRSTNTGISTIIDSQGRELKRLSPYITGNVDYSLHLPYNSQPKTLYQRFGYLSFLALFSLLFLFQLILIKLRNENHS